MQGPEAEPGAQSCGYRPLVEVRRGGRVESIHAGAVAVVDDTGRLRFSHGDPSAVTFLRSSAKPAQVLPLLMSGAAERFGLSDEEIAVTIGSHGGEPYHVATVRSILGKIGLGEEALQCGAHAPSHKPSAKALRDAGQAPSALHNNCSGKHAGMLALATMRGAPIETYLDPDHLVQRAVRETIAALAELQPRDLFLAVDGCSAPTYALPLAAAARIYARLLANGTLPKEMGAAAARALAAMRRHPEMVAGTDRICTTLMREGGDGLIAKVGAEGFYGLGFFRGGRGWGIALKIGDGEGERSRPAAVIEVLRRLDVLSAEQAASLRARFVPELRNHRGLVVGEVVPAVDLRPGP